MAATRALPDSLKALVNIQRPTDCVGEDLALRLEALKAARAEGNPTRAAVVAKLAELKAAGEGS